MPTAIKLSSFVGPIRRNSGQAVEAANVSIFDHGTTNEISVFADEALTTLIPQPLQTDRHGVVPGYSTRNSVTAVADKGSFHYQDDFELVSAADSGVVDQSDIDTAIAGLESSLTTAIDSGDAATLTAAQAYADGPVTVEPISGNYPLVIGDAQKIKKQTSGSASTITVPTNASVPFPIGTVISIARGGAGTVAIAGAGGVTIRAAGGLSNISAQYASVRLRKDATNEWWLEGSLS